MTYVSSGIRGVEFEEPFHACFSPCAVIFGLRNPHKELLLVQLEPEMLFSGF